MDTQKVINVLKDNGVSYNLKFNHVLQDGCLTEYQTLLENVVKKVEELAVYGVNEGFNNNIKKAVSVMTEVAVKITGEKTAKNIKKYKDNYEKNVKECDSYMKNANQVNLKSELIKWINDSIEGGKVLINVHAGNKRNAFLEDGIVKLNEIKSALENVADVSSLIAEEYAVKVLNNVKKWGNEAINNLHTSTSVNYLNDALTTVGEWSNLTESVKKGLFKGKTVVDGGNVKYAPNDMYRIKNSGAHLEKLQVFEDCLAETNEGVEERYDVSEKLEEIKQNRQNLIDAENKQREYFAMAQRGEIDWVAAEEEVNFLNYDINEYKQEISRLEKEKHNLEVLRRDSKSSIKCIKTISSKIKSYRSDLLLLTYFSEKFNMESAIKVIRGTASEEELAYVLNCDNVINAIEEEISSRSAVLREKINKIRQNSTLELNTVQTQNSIEQRKLDEDEARKRLMEKFNVKPTVVVEPVTEKPVQISDVNDII